MSAIIIAFPHPSPADRARDEWVADNHIGDYETFSDAVDALESWVDAECQVTIEALDAGGYRLFADGGEA